MQVALAHMTPTEYPSISNCAVREPLWPPFALKLVFASPQTCFHHALELKPEAHVKQEKQIFNYNSPELNSRTGKTSTKVKELATHD